MTLQQLNKHQIYYGLVMLAVFFTSYFYWDSMKYGILVGFQAKVTTFFLWAFVTIISILHYLNNINESTTAVNDKGSALEKPLDYLQFVGTYTTILSAAQTLGREFLLLTNFPEQSNCKNFNDFDKICFVSCVIVLISYAYVKMKPVVFEAFVKKQQVIPNLNLDMEQIRQEQVK